MALDDYLEPEVGIAVAATAAIVSPQVRNVLRRGAVLGLAGLLRAGDAISAAAQGATAEIQQTAARYQARETATEVQTTAKARGTTGTL